jgi:protein involved in temperature-dependent protein secretion
MPKGNDETPVELRGDTPRWIIDILDAVAMARGGKTSRMDILNEVAAEWASRRLHEANLVLRVTNAKGSNGEAIGKQRGDS